MPKSDNSIHSQERSREARLRIITAALELFASQGYAKTSTREIAKKAKVNLSAIKYYFGDKAGLYHATCDEHIGKKPAMPLLENAETPEKILNNHSQELSSVSLKEAFRVAMFNLVAPLKEDASVKLRIKLHMREFIEPTGLRPVEMNEHLRPHFEGIKNIIKYEYKKEKIAEKLNAEDLGRLSFSILSLPIFFFMGHELITKTQPNLLDSHSSIDAWTEKLALYATSMLRADIDLAKQSIK